jgi:hypothetical protein
MLSEAAFKAHITFSNTKVQENVNELRLSMSSVRLIFISTLNEVIELDKIRHECYTIRGHPRNEWRS